MGSSISAMKGERHDAMCPVKLTMPEALLTKSTGNTFYSPITVVLYSMVMPSFVKQMTTGIISGLMGMLR